MNRFILKRPEFPALHNMMERWEKQLCHVDGYMILRDGKLVAEAYQYPHSGRSRRLLHSVSKTVTAIAVGMAVEEGRISVGDKVLSFFPEYRPSLKSAAYLSELTIYHLLTMSVGHETDSIDRIFAEDEPAWQAFLDTPITDRPGTKFVYNSGATYMLSKIMTLVTGETVLEYLKPRLFGPLDISDADWDEIDGASTGGWGCFLSLSDMAKIGQLLLQKGKWNGKQLVSETWIDEMTSRKIDTEEANVYHDWQVGYCYQMWRCSREGCFRADGAFGQYILVLPPKNMVVAIWSEDAFSQDMLDIFWEEVYDKVDNSIYGTDGNAYEVYRRKCLEWSASKTMEPSFSYLEQTIGGVKYEKDGFDASFMDTMQFSFSGNGRVILRLEKAGNVSELEAGNTELCFGEEKMNFPIASFIRFGRKAKEKMRYAAGYQWMSDHCMKIHIDWLETAHSTEITCIFGKDRVAAVFSPSYGKFLIGSDSTPALMITDQWFEGEAQKNRERRDHSDTFQAYPGMPVTKII